MGEKEYPEEFKDNTLLELNNTLAGYPTKFEGSETFSKKPKIHISKDDAVNARETGRKDKSASTVYTEALEDSVHLKEVKEEKERVQEKIENEEIKIGDFLKLLRKI